jgi:hypothetical protein
MIVVELPIRLFQKGDFVRTPDGVGIVLENKLTRRKDKSIEYYDVVVQHKFPTSGNTSNKPLEFDAFENMVSQITDLEYHEENY